MEELTFDELYLVEGGKKSVSDWLLFGGSVAACFVTPYVGVPLCVITFIAT